MLKRCGTEFLCHTLPRFTHPSRCTLIDRVDFYEYQIDVLQGLDIKQYKPSYSLGDNVLYIKLTPPDNHKDKSLSAKDIE
jgi:hypothetical protein